MPHNGNDVTGVSVDLCLKSKKPHSKCKGEYRAEKKIQSLQWTDRELPRSFLKEENILLDLKGEGEIRCTLAPCT